MQTKDIKTFTKEIFKYYLENKRDLPWRNTTDPYRILVSEVMLQQTQVTRVIQKYTEFLQKFPTIKSLAQASKADVLTIWQGLGYNRRALFLKRTCEVIYECNPKHPHFPNTREELLELPGIGQSTAGAILAFAFNKPIPFIETNIRAVFIYFFFKENLSVRDIDILELLEKTLEQKGSNSNPREWYYALYDYGTMLKSKLGKNKTTLHKQSKHYHKQNNFKGSNREIRSNILKLFIAKTDTKVREHPIILNIEYIKKIILSKFSQATPENIKQNVKALEKEGFIVAVTSRAKGKDSYTLSVV